MDRETLEELLKVLDGVGRRTPVWPDRMTVARLQAAVEQELKEKKNADNLR